jgi:ribosomal protein S18 acetylase RimI-like enzyme
MGPVSNLHGRRDLAGDPSGRHPVVFRPAQREEVHAALQLILGTSAGPPAEEQVVDFLRFTMYRGIDLNDLWIAEMGGRIAWAILPVVSPGRTMLLFSPTEVADGVKDLCARPLIERVLEHHRDRAVDLAQVLLDPDDRSAIDVYRTCGFESLAELIYLDRDVRRAHEKALPPGFGWETYSHANHGDFAQTVSATYEGSLDCPRLNGRRHIEDVLAGHKAAGEFDPALWFLLQAGDGSAAGALLLSRSTRTDALELVYLGLLKTQRGRGFGDVMMQHALATAARIGCRRLSLAVDSQNTPALRLYHRHGLSRLCTRVALLRDLRDVKVATDSVKH